MISFIATDKSPKAIGPYSQAVATTCHKQVFISGQIPLSPQSMSIESSDIKGQCRQVLSNLLGVIEAAGGNKNSVVRTTIYLTNLENFDIVNNLYEEFFGDHRPARACVEVSRLPKDSLVEIDAILAL